MAYKMKTNIKSLIMDHGLVTEENGMGKVEGVTLNDGTIVVNKNLSKKKKDVAISHEKVHRDQILRGDLSYDDENVYWKGKKHPRALMKEGASNLPWEKEAYKKQKK